MFINQTINENKTWRGDKKSSEVNLIKLFFYLQMHIYPKVTVKHKAIFLLLQMLNMVIEIRKTRKNKV